MSSFRREFAVIGRPARVIAVVSYPAFAALFYYVFGAAENPPSDDFRFYFSLFFPLFFPMAILFYGYVYGDARRRGMRAVLWLLLAILIPNMLGVVLYFFMREPLPVLCGACSAPVKPGFAYCPACGAMAKPACPQCAKAVEEEWTNCAYCGCKLPAS